MKKRFPKKDIFHSRPFNVIKECKLHIFAAKGKFYVSMFLTGAPNLYQKFFNTLRLYLNKKSIKL